MSGDPEIQRAVRRTVGIAALRKMRHVVDAEQELDEVKARWVPRFSLFFIVAAALALAWIAIR